MAKLGGKVCLVTGATRGIGKGIALQLAQAGATVYITGKLNHKYACVVCCLPLQYKMYEKQQIMN